MTDKGMWPDEPHDVYDGSLDDMDECGNCGGEGYTYDCIDGCCVNAEDGCELCAHRCDWCNPLKPKRPLISGHQKDMT